MKTMKWKWVDRGVIQNFMWMLYVLDLNKNYRFISNNELQQLYLNSK